jgi:hypothetical protein
MFDFMPTLRLQKLQHDVKNPHSPCEMAHNAAAELETL